MTVTKGLLARLEAKPDKIDEVAEFLKSALPMVEDEPETVAWFAIRLSETTFGIFDAFPDESGQEVHLNGDVAEALMAKASELFTKDPVIEKTEVLASKLP